MKYYSIAELNVTDRGWARDYLLNVTPMIPKFGGRYLARTDHVERLEGERENPQMFLIIEWPSRDAAMDFYESEEYRPYRTSRMAGSTCEFLLVAGEDIYNMANI